MKNTGLLGSNIEYSKSPQIHHEYYKLKRLNFKLFDLQGNKVKYVNQNLGNSNIIDFNILIPYKEHIIYFLNQFTYPASEIGAVNTLEIEKRKLIGYNIYY